MKNLVIVFALAAVFAGCSDEPSKTPSEAEAFGYKGRDLEDPDEKMFFTTGPGVTNWLPTRVLSVCERYEFTSNELALVSAADIITPGSSFEKIPEAYSEKSKEPWFTTWSKETEAFGRMGVSGFIAHFDDAKKIWETGEPYFSTYYNNKEAALKALNELKSAIAAFAPKKFYEFEDCWVAEYVRLRVMGLCGQRPDGTWTCMLSINDKCTYGCGPWEPVETQQKRVDDIAFKAEVKAWREIVDKKAEENHEAVLAQIKARNIPLFGDDIKAQPTGDGRMVYVRMGSFPMSNVVAKTIWNEKAAELAKASGVSLGEEAASQQAYGMYDVWFSMASNDLFVVRLDMAFPKPSTNEVENANAIGEWRQLCFENVLPGNEPPPPPRKH